jgi:hypothetical protein
MEYRHIRRNVVGDDGKSSAARKEEAAGIYRFGGDTYDGNATHD